MRAAGIAWSADGTRAFIGDDLRHRVLELRLDTFEIRSIAGSGVPGFKDGVGSLAQFKQPHGVALVPGQATPTLAVADTQNHRIRLVALDTANVTSLAGNGSYDFGDSIAGLWAAFASPNALAWSGGVRSGGVLLVADTGNSAIRSVELGAGATATLAGAWVDTSEEGAVDAVGQAARFSQPKAIVLSADGKVAYVLDSENSLVRAVDLQSLAVSTVAGSGGRGWQNGFAGTFNQPRGLALIPADPARPGARGLLVVADTNNHLLRAVDLDKCDEHRCFIFTLAGSPGEAQSTDGVGRAARFNLPTAVAATPRPGGGAILLVSDSASRLLRRVEILFT